MMTTGTAPPPKMPPPWFVHLAWRIHRVLYRISGGRFLWTPASKRGWGALQLTTVGRKSGRERSVILGYLEEDSCLFTLAMNGWDEGDPAWWLNLEQHPDAVVRLAGQGPPSDNRAALMARAQVWTARDIRATDIMKGPSERDGFARGATIHCTYSDKILSGRSPKFACLLDENDV